MTKPKAKRGSKLVAVLAIALLFAIGFFVLGLFIDIQIISEYNLTPIPLTIIFPIVGALIGFFLARRVIKDAESEIETVQK